MALESRLPHGSLQHMTMINTPMFFAAVPRTFLDKMLTLTPDPTTGKPDVVGDSGKPGWRCALTGMRNMPRMRCAAARASPAEARWSIS